jgi:hypothetical protein
MQRLRAALLAVSPDELRQAVHGISEPEIRALPAQARPLASQLRRSKTPGDLLRKAPHAAIILTLADSLTEPCLDAIRTALGDAADDPTREQLDAAVGTVLEDFDVTIVRLLLAVVAAGDAEASDKCLAILVEDERFALPD